MAVTVRGLFTCKAVGTLRALQVVKRGTEGEISLFHGETGEIGGITLRPEEE